MWQQFKALAGKIFWAVIDHAINKTTLYRGRLQQGQPVAVWLFVDKVSHPAICHLPTATWSGNTASWSGNTAPLLFTDVCICSCVASPFVIFISSVPTLFSLASPTGPSKWLAGTGPTTSTSSSQNLNYVFTCHLKNARQPFHWDDTANI